MLLWFHNPDRYIPVSSPAVQQPELFWSSVGPSIEITADGYDGLVSPGPGAGGITATAGSPLITSYVTQTVQPLDAQFRVGGRFRVAALPASPTVLLGILDLDGTTIQTCVALNEDGTLGFYRGNLTTELRRSTVTITVGAFFRLGFKGRVSSTNGEGEVHLNSTASAPAIACRKTVVNTNPTGSAQWGGLYVGVSGDIIACHLYAADGTGVRNNRLMHGAYVRSYPAVYTPDRVHAEWASSEATIEAAIDDAEPDLELTTIQADEDGQKFSTAVGDGTGSPPTITPAVTTYGVQLSAVATNDREDYNYEPLVIVEGAEYHAPFTSPPRLDLSPAEWHVQRGIWESNPKTNNRWTTAQIEAAQFGGERVA